MTFLACVRAVLAISRVQALTVQPDDVIVIQIHNQATPGEQQNIYRMAGTLWPGHKIVVLDQMSIAVLRESA